MKLFKSKKQFISAAVITPILFAAFFSFTKQNRADIAQTHLTYPVKKGSFIVDISAQGVLEAKNAHTIVTPQLGWIMLKIAWMPPEGTWVKKGDVIVELEAGDIERNYLDALSEVDIAQADAQKGAAEMAMEQSALESQQKSMEATLKSSRLQLDKMEFEPVRTQKIKELEIAQSELEWDNINKKLESNKKIHKEETAGLQLKVKQAESKLATAKHHLSQLQLKAPVDGFIQYEQHWNGEKITEGTELWPNMPIVKIPDMSLMQVNLQVGETEAQKFKQSQRAEILIPSKPDIHLTGKVSKVARVATPVKIDREPTKVKRIEVIVDVDSTDIAIAPGLTARCNVIIEEVRDTIILPIECIFDKDSVKVVYVLTDDHFVAKPVVIEKTGENFAGVAGEFSGDERCALREPNPALVEWPKNMKPPTTKKQSASDTLRTHQEQDSSATNDLFGLKN